MRHRNVMMSIARVGLFPSRGARQRTGTVELERHVSEVGPGNEGRKAGEGRIPEPSCHPFVREEAVFVCLMRKWAFFVISLGRHTHGVVVVEAVSHGWLAGVVSRMSFLCFFRFSEFQVQIQGPRYTQRSVSPLIQRRLSCGITYPTSSNSWLLPLCHSRAVKRRFR